MKKTYKIDVDCANCAAKMETAANFMTQKMKVEFEEGADIDAVMKEILKKCKKVESDCEIYI